jgi:rhamnogalacturonyl hydrolase YesR
MKNMTNRIVSKCLLSFLCPVLLFAGPSLLAQDAAAAPAAPQPATTNQAEGFGQSPFNPNRFNPAYPVPYGPMPAEETAKVLNRIVSYLETNTPARIVNRQTGAEITDFSKPNPDATIERASFLIIGYEWGVTYAGMLRAAEVTGDPLFKEYVAKRMQFIADRAPFFRDQIPTNTPPFDGQPPAPGTGRRGGRGGRGGGGGFLFRSVLRPGSLDDSGAMCAAMIKAQRAGVGPDLRPLIDNYMDWIRNKQFRFSDGTLARNRPMAESLWLDDMYMSIPALAQMGKLTGEVRYYDDAVKQVLQFSQRMFNKEKGLYMHGWVAGMAPHPEFRWARANGWAVMAMAELLEVLPEDHPGRQAVLDQFRAHVRGLAECQDRTGLWHQLLDRPDSYLETSASAMYVYAIAHAVNRGWLDQLAYGPMVTLGWNGVTTKVNAIGQVEDTCVGTGMGFDPAFYYYRPVSVFAAHGYGPVLLAGAEMMTLSKNRRPMISGNAVQFGQPVPANR